MIVCIHPPQSTKKLKRVYIQVRLYIQKCTYKWGSVHTMKKRITIRLDEDILKWFRDKGSNYQTLINDYLRGAMSQKNSVGQQEERVIRTVDDVFKRVNATAGFTQSEDEFFKPMPKSGKK